MSSLLNACIVTFSLLFNKCFTQPIFVYDGTSTVELYGQFNWTLKYPLGEICEDWTWGKRLTVDLLAKTNEADLIVAFGTQEEYFAFTIAYDNVICVPLKYKPGRCRTILVTPQTGAPLQKAMVSLEKQYARSDDFRDSLILIDIDSTNETYHWTEQMTQWEVLVDAPSTSPWVENVSPLILDIRADRNEGETYLTIEKNGQNASILMGSTWDFDGEVYLYMGLDSIHDEIFELSGITSDDQCSWTNRPTTAPPTEATLNPTKNPTLTPTDSTLNPSQSPTDAPTPNTDNCNWECYLNSYVDLQQAFGTDVNAAENHYKYSGYYENRNCECIPTTFPTQSPNTRSPTTFPSLFPSQFPTETPSNDPSMEPTVDPTSEAIQSTVSFETTDRIVTQDADGDDDDDDDYVSSYEDESTEGLLRKQMINGVDNTYVLIGAGVIVVLLIVLVVVLVIRKFQGRTMKEPVASSDDDW